MAPRRMSCDPAPPKMLAHMTEREPQCDFGRYQPPPVAPSPAFSFPYRATVQRLPSPGGLKKAGEPSAGSPQTSLRRRITENTEPRRPTAP
jgi:hypothetical protein